MFIKYTWASLTHLHQECILVADLTPRDILTHSCFIVHLKVVVWIYDTLDNNLEINMILQNV